MRALAAESNPVTRENRAIELDRRFHEGIIALAGNDLLNTFFRQLSLHVNMTLMHEKTYHALESDWAEMHAQVLEWLTTDTARAVELLRGQLARATALWREPEAAST
jgi:DNA-binding GntR family transcriptional regulator